MLILKRAVKFAISTIVFCMDSISGICMAIFGRRRPTRCVVLYYHVVGREDRAHFARQLDEISRLANPIWADRPDMIGDGPHYAAITFDDGYRSFRENALPKLTERKIPVHLFVPSGIMGDPPNWLPADDPERRREVVMTAEELKALDPKCVAIGSHCVSHRDLTALGDEEAAHEIIASKRALEETLGREVPTISFPHGFYRESHIEQARRAGYRKVFTISSALAFENGDEYVVDRVRVDPGDWMFELRLKTLGCYRWMAVASRVLAVTRMRLHSA
jgi:peptidoglycan/xylan/chitin deacetylase (PgdA/CDA1 family)